MSHDAPANQRWTAGESNPRPPPKEGCVHGGNPQGSAASHGVSSTGSHCSQQTTNGWHGGVAGIRFVERGLEATGTCDEHTAGTTPGAPRTLWAGGLLWLLVELWVLNLIDFLLTRHALWRGLAQEAIWVTDFFFRQGTLPAVAFKIGTVTVGVLLFWRLRHCRTALVAAVLLTGFFAIVVAYQVVWLIAI